MFTARLAMGRSARLFRTAGSVLVAVLLLALRGGMSTLGGTQYLHPTLLALAAEHPTPSLGVNWGNVNWSNVKWGTAIWRNVNWG